MGLPCDERLLLLCGGDMRPEAEKCRGTVRGDIVDEVPVEGSLGLYSTPPDGRKESRCVLDMAKSDRA